MDDMPKCSGCGKPLTNSFMRVEGDGGVYHGPQCRVLPNDLAIEFLKPWTPPTEEESEAITKHLLGRVESIRGKL